MKKFFVGIFVCMMVVFGVANVGFASEEWRATELIPNDPCWSYIGSNKTESWYLLQNPIKRNLSDGSKVAITKMVYRKGERYSKKLYVPSGSYEYKIVWLNVKENWYAIMAQDLYSPNHRLIASISDNEMIKIGNIEKIPFNNHNIGGIIIDKLNY